MTRVALALLCAISTASAIPAFAAPKLLDNGPGRAATLGIFGGALAERCQWPSTVALRKSSGLCTGTLVHPKVVLYAAHCGTDISNVIFGEDVDKPQRTIKPEFCVVNPLHKEVGPADFALCKLTEPATGVPLAPIAMGCETAGLTVGAKIVIAGFGRSNPGAAGVKRWVETVITEVNPGHIILGKDGKNPCHMDSGGPAFLKLADGSWRAFGIVSGRAGVDPFGTPPPDLCEKDATYVRMDANAAWFEMKAGLDVTPCHKADGTWDPSAACKGFLMDPLDMTRDWASSCATDKVSPPSTTCGPAWAPGADAGSGPSPETGGTDAGAGAEARDGVAQPDGSAGQDAGGGRGGGSGQDADAQGGCRVAAHSGSGVAPLCALGALLVWSRSRGRGQPPTSARPTSRGSSLRGRRAR